eukprot:GHVS01006946.1.p1 GENE.GHVS01006946.1~~GHVS01006946.1.p1  ORF type:complete len:413 (-),score=67.12 GHVS01006946.1:433-1671(-)
MTQPDTFKEEETAGKEDEGENSLGCDDGRNIQVGEEGGSSVDDTVDELEHMPVEQDTATCDGVDAVVTNCTDEGNNNTEEATEPAPEDCGGEGGDGVRTSTETVPEPCDPGKFFVGGISPDAWDEDLLLHFQQYGRVSSVQVMCDNSTGRNRGFGFVTMAPSVPLEDIFRSKHVIKNKKVEVRKMQVDGASNLRRKIFIGGINRIVNEDTLTAYFKTFGTIDKLTVMRDGEGASRGFGFVVFDDEDVVSLVLKKSVHSVDERHTVDVRAAEARHHTDRRAAMRGGMPPRPPGRPPMNGPHFGAGFFPPCFPPHSRPPPGFIPPFASRGPPGYPPMYGPSPTMPPRGYPLGPPAMFGGPPAQVGAGRGRGRLPLPAGGAPGTDWFGLSVDGYEPQRALPGGAGGRPSHRAGPY